MWHGRFVYTCATMNMSNGVNYGIIINMMSSVARNFSAPDIALRYHHSIFSPLLVKMSLWGTWKCVNHRCNTHLEVNCTWKILCKSLIMTAPKNAWFFHSSLPNYHWILTLVTWFVTTMSHFFSMNQFLNKSKASMRNDKF